MILEVKMLDVVEVLGWCDCTWSAVVKPVGTAHPCAIIIMSNQHLDMPHL